MNDVVFDIYDRGGLLVEVLDKEVELILYPFGLLIRKETFLEVNSAITDQLAYFDCDAKLVYVKGAKLNRLPSSLLNFD